MDQQLIDRLVRRGAEAEIAELQNRIDLIRAGLGGKARAAGRKPMSAAARKAVSLRMKKYWSAKHKAQK